eukprot:14244461-Ditylum_brightwellii.AAC.1
MDTNPGETTDEDSILDLTQRKNCAEDEEPDAENDIDEDIEESLPLDMKGDQGDYLEDLYNEFNLQADNYELDVIVDHHFKDSILILKA